MPKDKGKETREKFAPHREFKKSSEQKAMSAEKKAIRDRLKTSEPMMFRGTQQTGPLDLIADYAEPRQVNVAMVYTGDESSYIALVQTLNKLLAEEKEYTFELYLIDYKKINTNHNFAEFTKHHPLPNFDHILYFADTFDAGLSRPGHQFQAFDAALIEVRFKEVLDRLPHPKKVHNSVILTEDEVLAYSGLKVRLDGRFSVDVNPTLHRLAFAVGVHENSIDAKPENQANLLGIARDIIQSAKLPPPDATRHKL